MYNNNNNKQLRCVIYTRKSCEEGLELEYNSLDSQRDACVSYILSQKYNNWLLVDKEYNDGGYSGGNLDRPALKELINDITNNLVYIVVVYKIDRLSRSLMDFSKLSDLFNRHNVSFVSVTQNFDTSNSMGKLMLNILLSFAQFEREMSVDRMRDKLRSQQRKGLWTGGNIPFGYDVIDKKLIVNDNEAKIVKFIYDKFIETESINDVMYLTKELNYKSKSYTTIKKNKIKEGNYFDRGNIYFILTNKTYLGLIENKRINEVYEGIHEVIITEEQFAKVREILDKNRNDKIYYNRSKKEIITIDDRVVVKYNPNRNSNVPYLLKGLVKCKCCNSTLTPTYTTKSDNKRVYRYYKSNKSMKHKTECNIGSIQAEEIESVVLNEIYKILKSSKVIANTIRLSSDNLDTNDIISSFHNIETLWKELYPKEHMEIVNNIIEEITVPKGLTLQEIKNKAIPIDWNEQRKLYGFN